MKDSYEFAYNHIDIDKFIKKHGSANKIYTLKDIYSIDDVYFYWFLRENQNMGISNLRGSRIEIHWNVK